MKKSDVNKRLVGLLAVTGISISAVPSAAQSLEKPYVKKASSEESKSLTPYFEDVSVDSQFHEQAPQDGICIDGGCTNNGTCK